jgi:3-hydroxybutyryl-CoA dehydrogenase
MEIKRVLVQGAGTMGNGIAQVSAQAGFEVIMMDLSTELVQKGMDAINKSLQRSVDKGKMGTDDKSATLSRIKLTTDLNEAKGVDLAIEAVFEELEIKKQAFKVLDEICPPHAILASNTSSLPIVALASATKRPDKVLGLHFMNPVPVMRGVEIIRAMTTSDETLAVGKQFIQKLGKEVVEAVDYAGFIATRILDAMLNEAVRCVMDGNKPEEIDRAMKVCTNFPMGPLELIDLAGVDIVLHGLETMEKDFGDRYHPAPLLRQMFRAGHLGRKTKKGFYYYLN